MVRWRIPRRGFSQLTLLAALLGAVSICGVAEESAKPEMKAEVYQAWPFDAAEAKRRQEETAKRLGIPVERTLDLGNGVKLELVLIPAGRFIMGTPEPSPVDEGGYRREIQTGQVTFGFSGGALLVLLVIVLVQSIRKRQRPQYSLARFLVMTVAAGIGLMGGLHCHFSARALANARSEYEADLARHKNSLETEKPAHEVTLTQAFYIGKYEVTQEQYQRVMGNNPSHFKGRDLPVERVSWDDAQEFCKKASGKAGGVARLPTDAEWEYACRAGTKTAYCTGDSEADLVQAGWCPENSKGQTHPVGQKTPNAWGAYDMHGNVWEWCADWYEPHKAEAVMDPQGSAEGDRRMSRGGSWGYPFENCRSAHGGRQDPDLRNFYFGFRLVWLVPRTP